MVVQILTALAILLVITWAFSQFAGPYFAKYVISDRAIQFNLFGLRVWKCPFDDISDIRLISFAEMLINPSLHLMNRPFAQYVLVRRGRGLFRTIIITPEDAENLITLVRGRIDSSTLQSAIRD